METRVFLCNRFQELPNFSQIQAPIVRILTFKKRTFRATNG